MSSVTKRQYCPNCKQMYYTEYGKCPKCGTFFQNRGYSFTYREQQPDGSIKQRRSTAYDTRKEAEIACAKKNEELEENNRRRSMSAGYDMTVADICENYVQSIKAHSKESSALKTHYLFTKYVYPHFDATELARNITPAQCREWQDKINAMPFSVKYKRLIRGAFSSAYNNAKEYMIENPFKFVKGFRDTSAKKEMSVWTEKEFMQFLGVIPKDSIDYAYFAFMYIMGTRRGEALALTWQDVDFDRHCVRINKTVTRDTFDHHYAVTPPKTKNSNRTVEIPENLERVLAQLKERDNGKAEDIVFYGATPQTHYPFNTLRLRQNRYIRESGVKQIRGHDLRHSSVAFMISKSHDQLTTLYDIAARIGDTVEQVMKTYGHLFPRKKKDYLDNFNSLNI